MTYDLIGRPLYPLSELLEDEDFPFLDFLPKDLLDGLYYTEADLYANEDNLSFSIHLAFEKEIEIKLPGIDSLALVIGGAGEDWSSIAVKLVIGTDASLTLEDVPIAIKIDRNILEDVKTKGPALLQTQGTLHLYPDWSIDFETDGLLSLPECEIVGSGVTVSATGIAWNFMRGQTLQEATDAGIAGEFIGLAFQEAKIKLPKDISNGPELAISNCCIGTGGFTGKVSASFETAPEVNVGGFDVELHRVQILFQESQLIVGEIEALLKDIELFDTDVAVNLQLHAGGLNVALSAVPERQTSPGVAIKNGLLTLTKPDVLELELTAMALTITSGGGALQLSGTVNPLFSLPGGEKLPGFRVDALMITSKGEVTVSGGWLSLPKASRVSLGPFQMELSQFGIGKEGNERWIGFSGSLELVAGAPIKASFEGLKVRWTKTMPPQIGVELTGIGIKYKVDGVLNLEASVRYSASEQRFDGAGTLQLTSLNLTISCRVAIKRSGDFTSLFLYLLVQPPAGIPLFNTGLAIYGLDALYARNMIPNKQEQERWYNDWYRRPEIGTVDSNKWKAQKGGQAFGGGMIVGTAPDKGYSVAAKGLLIVVVPGPVIMLDARANLLKDPAALAVPTAQAMFNSLAVFDGARGTLDLAIEPHYVFPEKGELIDVSGIAEAHYNFNDPRAWHVYIGRKEREQRIRARILSIFEANAYLMLEPDKMEMGGFIGYDAEYSAGPASLSLQAYMEGAAEISWRPKQLIGSLHLQGLIALRVAGVGLGLSAAAIVKAQAPQPYKVEASIHVKADLPWPIPDFETKVDLLWEADGPPRLTAPLQGAGIEHQLTSATWRLEDTEPVVPLDGRISIIFDRPVQDTLGVGSNAAASIDEILGEYRLRSELKDLKLEVWDASSGQWVLFASPNASRKLYGMWQSQPGDNSQGNRRLMLWVRSPFEWLHPLSDVAISQLDEAESFSPCEPQMETRLLDFESESDLMLEPNRPYLLQNLIFSASKMGAWILELEKMNKPFEKLELLPRVYRRCLMIPNQWGYTTVPQNPVPPGGGTAPPKQQEPLRITFPADAKAITVLALASGGWSLEGFDSKESSLAKTATTQLLNQQNQGGNYLPSQLTISNKGIRTVTINCLYGMAILAIVVEGAPSETEISVRRQELQQSLERFKSEEIVFEAKKRYRLMVTTTISETTGKSLVGAQVESPLGGSSPVIAGSSCTFTNQFLFATEGPPGDAKLSEIAPGVTATLDTLEPYIREVLPSHGAPAVYRNYDIGVAFAADYVDHMFRSNSQSQQLEINLINDRNERLTLVNSMGRGNETVLRREERLWIESLNRSTCQLTLSESSIVKESIVKAKLSGPPLEPRKRYEAHLHANPKGAHEHSPLYQWSFVTSQYVNFKDHFSLRTRLRKAQVQMTLQQWQQLIIPLLKSGDPWQAVDQERELRRQAELSNFQAIFKQTGLINLLPADLEIHAITSGTQTFGIMVSSPEPFDWKRCTIDILPAISIPLQIQSRAIRDEDGTRAIIVPYWKGMPIAIPNGTYKLKGTFHRNIGQGEPVLSERGNTVNEEVMIPFTLPLPS
nr:hypothetical protein [Neobacillus sp. Marseille-Q6967]